MAMIEIHNKPKIEYRYQTTTVLMINAWELMFKSFIYKYIGKNKIWNSDVHTISIRQALEIISNSEQIMDKEYTKLLKANIELLEEYRNVYMHYNLGEIDPIIFGLLLKSTFLFVKFVKEHFNKDLTAYDNLIILPIGLKLPYDPVEYLKNYDSKTNPYYTSVVNKVKSLLKDNINESVFVSIETKYVSTKKIQNSDIIVGIESGHSSLTIEKKVRISDEKGSQPVHFSDEIIKQKFPLTHQMLMDKVKKKDPSIKQDSKLNAIIQESKKDSGLSFGRKTNPHSTKTPKSFIYSEELVDIVIEKYHNI